MENHLAIELEAMVKEAQPLFATQSCCIYKVPHSFRQTNEDAYTPVIVSIGPLHHGNPSRLVTMEAHKQVYCQHFIQRSWASLTDLVSCVQQMEPQIRACYSEKIDLTPDELVKVIFIDCCFVIEFSFEDEEMRNDAIFAKPWMSTRLRYDLMLLENQVPFFVYDKIYNLAFASQLLTNGGEQPSFMRFAVTMFSYYNTQELLPPAASDIAHFTDLLRYLYLPPSHTTPSRNPQVLDLGHSASELVEAGVKFQVNKSSHGILDMEFKHGILKIPHISVDDSTEVWLRNIVALEQCHYPEEHYITDCVSFFKRLVNSNKDADVLIKAGIIQNAVCGNDTSVANLFRDVNKDIIVSNANVNYIKLCHDLNAYCNDPWRSKMATLKRDYFTTPWKTVASIAGIVLLILTVIQTVCSVIQV